MSLVDRIRDVPEAAVRLYLGAAVAVKDGQVEISFENRTIRISTETYDDAKAVVNALSIRERDNVRCASDVLALRHDAEDLFLERLVGLKGVPKILFVPAGDMASAYYRARIPSDILNRSGGAIAHFTTRIDPAKAAQYEVLWIQLVAAPALIEIAKVCQANGMKVVYDYDDRFDVVPEYNPASEVFVKEKQDWIRQLIALADCVTVSTKALADHAIDVLGKNPAAVRVFPNRIMASALPVSSLPDPKVFKILWAGSPTHKADLAIVAPALNTFLKEHKGKARFVCFGEQVPDALADCREYIDLLPFVAFEDYPDALANVGADLAIAPLEDNEFNRSRSAVKALEYAAAGYPVLMSWVGEYPEIVRLGFPGVLVQDADWLRHFNQRFKDKHEGMALVTGSKNSGRRWTIDNRCILKSQAGQYLELAKELTEKVPAGVRA